MNDLARLGTATVYEATDGCGLIDLDLIQVLPGSRASGPARTVRCGQGDNLMVHAVMSVAQPGDVLVITMPEPAPVALLGELLATQAVQRRVAAILVDGAVRDLEQLRSLGLPIWAHWVRVRSATKQIVGELDVAVRLGGVTVQPRDVIVLDADGAIVVPAAGIKDALAAAERRERNEEEKRAQYRQGALSYDLLGLRSRVERRA